MDKKLKSELKDIKPGWTIPQGEQYASLHEDEEADAGYVETGLESNFPTNYERSLIGNPKGLSDFEVSKDIGRLG
jgi:hypothetical protein